MRHPTEECVECGVIALPCEACSDRVVFDLADPEGDPMETVTIEVERRFIDPALPYLESAEYHDNLAEVWLSDDQPVHALTYHMHAQLLRALPQPVQVGHLATTDIGTVVRVDYIGQKRAFCTYPSGGEGAWRLDSLTYSRPCPEGWPEDGAR